MCKFKKSGTNFQIAFTTKGKKKYKFAGKKEVCPVYGEILQDHEEVGEGQDHAGEDRLAATRHCPARERHTTLSGRAVRCHGPAASACAQPSGGPGHAAACSSRSAPPPRS